MGRHTGNAQVHCEPTVSTAAAARRPHPSSTTAVNAPASARPSTRVPSDTAAYVRAARPSLGSDEAQDVVGERFDGSADRRGGDGVEFGGQPSFKTRDVFVSRGSSPWCSRIDRPQVVDVRATACCAEAVVIRSRRIPCRWSCSRGAEWSLEPGSIAKTCIRRRFPGRPQEMPVLFAVRLLQAAYGTTCPSSAPRRGAARRRSQRCRLASLISMSRRPNNSELVSIVLNRRRTSVPSQSGWRKVVGSREQFSDHEG